MRKLLDWFWRPSQEKRIICEAEKREDIFDWVNVPQVSPDTIHEWRGSTDAETRKIPLLIALQVHDELVRKMMGNERMDAVRLSEIRGGLWALARFAQVYSQMLVDRKKKGQVFP